MTVGGRHEADHMHDLTDHDRLVLDIAGRYYAHPGRRAADAMDELGITETRLWARAMWLVDQPAAVAEMPQVCARLRRLRERRAAARTAR